MQYAAAILALAATAYAQGVTEKISPDGGALGSETFSGSFQIQTQNLTDQQPLKGPVICGSGEGSLKITLTDGTLIDGRGRTGYIADNRQFQFDGPPQTGAVYTSGFSTLGNGSLALGQSAIFYNCLSGTFNNIYDQSQGGQCYPVTIQALKCSSDEGAVTQASDINGGGAQTGGGSSTATASSSSAKQTADGMAGEMFTQTVAAPSAPVATGSAPVATGTAVVPPTATGPTSSPSPFLSGADAVAVGQKFLAAAVGAVAVAMF